MPHERYQRSAQCKAESIARGDDPFIPKLVREAVDELQEPNQPGRRGYEQPKEWDRQLEALYDFLFEKAKILLVMDEGHLRACMGRLACDLFLRGYRDTRIDVRSAPSAG